ncbi:AarF/ABC1/UbiB kinase family protein [Candidatus Woesearchaeota archaeon]|nr:MAG: AarF/ABC1/UbiB kinase family protein [Candidatus Woesearchaeota archaeon]
MEISERIKDVKRFEEIVRTFAFLEGKSFYSGSRLASLFKGRKRADKKNKAVAYREAFEKLGGAFIKLGQLLSLRPDLISEEYCEEFRKLQDKVPPFTFSVARRIIEHELNKPLEDLFKSFDRKPIAAASIGQVHRAVLRTGEKVVVKVQRPDAEERFRTDIEILEFVAKEWESHTDPRIIRPVQIVEEFKRYTRNELDYVNEARNASRFRDIFRKSSDVIVPEVFWRYTTGRVLTLQEIIGKRIDLAIPKSQKARAALMQKVAEVVFRQIFEEGVFHADPHPGNIFLTPEGKIALLDFGIVGFLDEDLQENITELFIAMIERDLASMTQAMIKLGIADDTDVDEKQLQQDLREYLGKYYGTELHVIKIGEVFSRLVAIARKHQLVLPSNFVLFGKSLVTLEGLGDEIDPHFNLVKTAKPYVHKLIKKRAKPKSVIKSARNAAIKLKQFVDVFPQQTGEIMRNIKRGDRTMREIHKDLEVLTIEMDRSSKRLVIGILMGSFLIGGALVADIPQQSLGGIPILPLAGFVMAIILGLMLAFSMHEEKKEEKEIEKSTKQWR